MKKEKDAPEETFNATAFAEFFSGPRGRQARTVLAVLGIIGDNSHCTKNLMNPGNQTRANTRRRRGGQREGGSDSKCLGLRFCRCWRLQSRVAECISLVADTCSPDWNSAFNIANN